ncbi:hypothetical protein M513_10912 [Trichuris suis]|uniref:Uncharacterized protein n=1 Tax=Trichuris suis TaxID=68888 RepID=A0A085LTA2_9BILA|nr:hypothetical protein M513_10912 [Trichuris suis]
MQCALMHSKTESALKEVRSTEELMRLSGKLSFASLLSVNMRVPKEIPTPFVQAGTNVWMSATFGHT